MRPDYNESNIPPVSGGKDNNPDKWDIVALTGNREVDLAALNASQSAGFHLNAQQPEVFVRFGYVLMSGYKE